MSFALHDFLCPTCGAFEELVERPAPDERPCPTCGAPAERTISAPALHTKYVVSASSGRNDAKPDWRSMDTRPLAEGQPYEEWKADRAKIWEQDRQRRVKEMLE